MYNSQITSKIALATKMRNHTNEDKFTSSLLLHNVSPAVSKDYGDVHTPPGPTNNGDFMDMESTLAGGSVLKSFNTEQQFDIIATNVNSTLQELNRIYNLIGYSEKEIFDKKSEIFQVIQETITSFTSNLQREKNNIENECEWLRQQIRIILAMLNDNNGDKNLKLSSRGIVFDDTAMYEKGYKEDVLQQMNQYQNQKHFYVDLPFNMANPIPSDDFSMQQQFEYIVNQTPKLSLLQFKTRLNSIFLEVLKAFIKVFRKFNEQNVLYWENVDCIGDTGPPSDNAALLSCLPSKEEAEEHSKLIEEFENTIKKLNLTSKNFKPELQANGKSDDELAFIISSPRKAKKEHEESSSSLETTNDDSLIMDHLRDINYKIVRALRSLKVTKITPEVVLNLTKEVQWSETELQTRMVNMKEVISQCLNLIDVLSLNERDVISIQKMQDMAAREGPNISSEGYFDIETLKFIETNPREFGLMDHHLSFVSKLAHRLQIIKDAKQKKWEYYSNTCIHLWEKLGEHREFVQLFLDANSTLTDMSLTNLKMELNRLYLKRSEFIESFIVDARREIEVYHQMLLHSEEQKLEFKFYNYDVNDDSEDKEQILSEHEKELECLKEEYQLKNVVLSLYQQLNELLADQKFLTDSSKDSSRLLSKNSCKILLNEEKIRKKINKNLPRVLETLKQEIIKFNNENISQGKRAFLIEGQDFFERLLVIESEIGNQNNSKFGRVRNNRNMKSESPKKARAFPSSRSPTLSFSNRSPNKITKEKPRLASPNNLKRATSTMSPISQTVHEKKKTYAPLSRMPSGSQDTGSTPFVSPHKSQANFSGFSGLVGLTQLQPLNSPLALNAGSIYSDSSLDARPESRADSTLYSMCSRVSPLRGSSQANIKTNFSPIKGYDFVDSSMMEDKENKSSTFHSKFGLSPIRVISNLSHPSEPETRRLSTTSLANSTIIGDDYQHWREERIRALNGHL